MELFSVCPVQVAGGSNKFIWGRRRKVRENGGEGGPALEPAGKALTVARLTRTSRQVYLDLAADPSFYRSNVFSFGDPYQLHLFLAALTPGRRRAIRSIRVHEVRNSPGSRRWAATRFGSVLSGDRCRHLFALSPRLPGSAPRHLSRVGAPVYPSPQHGDSDIDKRTIDGRGLALRRIPGSVREHGGGDERDLARRRATRGPIRDPAGFALSVEPARLRPSRLMRGTSTRSSSSWATARRKSRCRGGSARGATSSRSCVRQRRLSEIAQLRLREQRKRSPLTRSARSGGRGRFPSVRFSGASSSSRARGSPGKGSVARRAGGTLCFIRSFYEGLLGSEDKPRERLEAIERTPKPGEAQDALGGLVDSAPSYNGWGYWKEIARQRERAVRRPKRGLEHINLIAVADAISAEKQGTWGNARTAWTFRVSVMVLEDQLSSMTILPAQ
ncbi:hypothetical protein DL763_004370 [Monosporascus cannonballus]|nr:hypothetical protein DL763_004370 [Monosporascus cannonballus]